MTDEDIYNKIDEIIDMLDNAGSLKELELADIELRTLIAKIDEEEGDFPEESN